jgi:molybdate transport system substrate-binding protein
MSNGRMLQRFSGVIASIGIILIASLPSAADSGRITVFAAASLREAFEAAAPAFTKKTGVAVTYNFGGSDTLAGQIAQGAPADVFASANDAQMKRVVDAALAAGQPQVFARNRLVLIVPRSNPANIVSPADLAKPGVKVVLAAASVPIGGYARAAFAKLAGRGGYPADFAAAVERNIVSDELDVKAIATKVALGEGDAGVVYTTDVTPQLSPKVKEISFPADAAPEARYPIVTIKNAANSAGAAAFVDFILGEGQSYLRARGFLAP